MSNSRESDMQDFRITGVTSSYAGASTTAAGRPARAGIGIALVLLLSGCVGAKYYKSGQEAAADRDWDAAVADFTRALKEEPSNTLWRADLMKVLHEAAYLHIAKGQQLARVSDYKGAMAEYQKARTYEPSNAFLAQLIAQADATMNAPPQTQAVVEEPEGIPAPLLRQLPQKPVKLDFKNANLKDILRALGQYADINFVFDDQVQDKNYTITLGNVSFEQALTTIMLTTHCFYRVVDSATILIAPDNQMKRRQIEQLQVRTFYISNADLNEMRTILQQAVGAQLVTVNTSLSAITIKDTPEKLRIAEQIIRANDKCKAEVLLELEIVEVNRQKVRQFGLDLGTNAGGQATSITGAFSPRNAKSGVFTARDLLTTNSLDFAFTLPTAAYKMLLTDSDSKIIANPKLRGVEGKPMSLKMGDRVPIPVTTFTPIAGGGAAQQPITSFQYENIGINIDITPRVHRNNEITMDVKLDISSVSGKGFGGLPTFGNRQVTATMRLKEGESNLLGGLLREEDKKYMSGLPGIKNIPIIGKLFSYTDSAKTQTDIILSLTPHIIRLPEITDRDRAPIWVGTMENPSPFGALPQMRGPMERPVPPGMEGREPGMPGTGQEEPPEAAPEGEETPSKEPQNAPKGPASMSINPTSSEVELDSEFSVTVNLTGVDNVGSVNLVIGYDPDLLSISDANVQEGGFMRSDGGQANFFKHIDAQGGTITIGITRSGAAKGASGSGNLVTLLFSATGEGSCNVQIEKATVTNAQFQPIAVDSSAVADIEIYSPDSQDPENSSEPE